MAVDLIQAGLSLAGALIAGLVIAKVKKDDARAREDLSGIHEQLKLIWQKLDKKEDKDDAKDREGRLARMIQTADTNLTARIGDLNGRLTGKT